MEHLKPVKLYLDDIESIIEVLKEVSDSITISTKDYILESSGELANLKQDTINELRISVSNPSVSLEFKPNDIWLHISEDNTISRGLFEKIKNKLSERRKLFWFLYSPLGGGLLGGIGLNLIISNLATVNLYLLSLGGFTLLISLLFLNASFKKYSVIVLKRKADAPSFISRNLDDIGLAFISAVLGVLLTLLTQFLLGKSP